MSELAQLMEEPAGGQNQGRRASDNPEAEGRYVPLGVDEGQAAQFMRSTGWTMTHAKDGARAGVHAHRGILHHDEYVDLEALRPAVEQELGFSYGQIRSVYRQGRLSDEGRELRGLIDARLLALSASGANIALLGRVLGFHVNDAGACEALNNALARARKEEQWTPIP